MNNKICIVTGASSGIGQQIALALHQRGAYVIMIDIVSPCETIAAMVSIGPKRFETHLADLSSQRDVLRVATTLCQAHPVIDVLVNNAGRHIVERETSVDGYEMNFALNSLGSSTFTLRMLESLKRATSARIINIASEAHRFPGRYNFEDINTEQESMLYAYGKSKFAVILFSKALARELENTSITVNAVCPGLVSTQIFSNFLPPWLARLFTSITFLGLMSTAKQGASLPIQLSCDDRYEEVTGKFFGSHSVLQYLAEHKKTNCRHSQEALFDFFHDVINLPSVRMNHEK